MKYNCLIVDDELPLAESTAEYFNLFEVTTASVSGAKECLDFFKENTADLILLDINLGSSSGFDLCRELRKTIQVPILFISARQSDDDIILALGIGGDDYIRKPYTLGVLLAKVKAVLKRCASEDDASYRCEHLYIDFSAGRAYVDDEPLKLKAMEYKLLCYLVQNRGRVISKDEFFKEVWGDTFTGDGTLNVHIRHLREHIEPDPNLPRYIKTAWGTGYSFEEPRS